MDVNMDVDRVQENDEVDAVFSTEGKKETVKISVVGDSGVGKTCMLKTFVNKRYPNEEERLNRPSLFENASGTIHGSRQASFEVPATLDVGNCRVELGLTDTIGTDEYRRFRETFCVNTEIFLICFSVTEPETLEHVRQNWLTEIRILTPKTPFILVGMKTDLRGDTDILAKLTHEGLQPVDTLQGIKAAKTFGAKEYAECSSLNNVGVRRVFEKAITVLDQEKQQRAKVLKRKSQHICHIS